MIAALSLGVGQAHAEDTPDEGLAADAAPVAVLAPGAQLYRDGVARRDAGDRTEALALFRAARAAAEVDDSAVLRGDIEGAIGELVGTSMQVVVDADAVDEGAWVAYSIDGRELEREWLGKPLLLAAGRHLVRAVRPGCAQWQQEIEGDAGGALQVQVPDLRCFVAQVTSRGKRDRLPEPEPEPEHRYARIGLVVAGASVVPILGGVIFWTQSSSDWDDARAAGCSASGNDCPTPLGVSLVADARRHKTRAIVALAIGGIGAATSVGLFYYGSKQRSRKHEAGLAIAPLVGDDRGVLITIGGEF